MFLIKDLLNLAYFDKAQLHLQELSIEQPISDLELFNNTSQYKNDTTLIVFDLLNNQIELNHLRIMIRNRNLNLLLLIKNEEIAEHNDFEKNLIKDAIPIITLNKTDLDFSARLLETFYQRKSHLNETVEKTLVNFKNNRNDFDVPALLRLLKQTTDHNNSLLRNYQEIVYTTAFKEPLISTKAATTYLEYPNLHFNFHLESVDNKQLLINEIPTTNEETIHLIVELEHDYTYFDLVLIDLISSQIQLRLLKQLALRNNQVNNLNEYFDNILNGKYASTEQMIEFGLPIGLNHLEKYRILTLGFLDLETKEYINEQDNPTRFEMIFNLTNKMLRQYWPNTFVRKYSNRLTLYFLDNDLDNLSFKKRHHEKFCQLINSFEDLKVTLKVGISEKTSIATIPRFALQSLRIIKLALLLSSSDCLIFYDDLGVYKLFIDINEKGSLKELIPDAVAEIDNYNPEYLDTLQIFLDQNQNYNETAKLLYVHPKTVRYRINRLIEEFHLVLNIPEVVLYLQIGITAYKLMNSKIML